jgi:microcystin-dependent protein
LSAYLAGKFNKGNEGDGNFRLPESRGEFLRGWDHGRGVDVGRVLGSWQADDNKAHTHTATGTFYSYAYLAAGPGRDFQSSNVTTSSSGGTEARPRNLAVMWCIKAWNAPINQGTIDITALAALAQQATELDQGTAKVATQVQTDAGTDDKTIVTPKKMHWGFASLLSTNGYIVFPSWMGGLIIQWIGSTTLSVQGANSSFPLAFPTTLFGVWLTGVNGSVPSSVSLGPRTLTGFTAYSSILPFGFGAIAIGR